MKEIENNALFWQKVDALVLSSPLIIDRPKGTHHQKYFNLVYPVDYGYLDDSINTESTPIEVYRGSEQTSSVDALVITVDILKKDCIAKLLWGCNQQETDEILEFLNQTEFQKAVLVRRGSEVPSWATSD